MRAGSHGTIAEALIANAAAPREQRRSAAELAQLLGVTVDSVHQATSRLRKAGQLAPSERQYTRIALPPRARTADGGSSGDNTLVDAQALLDGIENEVVLDDQGRRKILSRLAR